MVLSPSFMRFRSILILTYIHTYMDDCLFMCVSCVYEYRHVVGGGGVNWYCFMSTLTQTISVKFIPYVISGGGGGGGEE